jgi:hypothetical protein
MPIRPRTVSPFAALVLLAIGTGCGGPPTPAPATLAPRIALHEASEARRVCNQLGFGSPNAGGGSIVFTTGAEGAGVGIDTLRGDHTVAPGTESLCPVVRQSMRICPEDDKHRGSVDVHDAVVLGAHKVGELGRGRAITFLEYVSDHGVTEALVDVDGHARYVLADEICHVDGVPKASRATQVFSMNLTAPAARKAYRPRSTEAIRRIVIHNTESTLDSTLHHFGRPEANTSAHVVIDRDGTIYRVVEDQFAAFHAGSSKDGLGGYNTTSLGIEVVAFSDPQKDPTNESAFFSDAQRLAVIRLVDFWMDEYKLEIAPDVLANHASGEAYNDLEYRRAAVTIHRLTKADRGTDCPRLLFPNSPEGDEAFFRWREETFSPAARRGRSPATTN